MKLIGISGSLRKESFNTKMLHAAASCLPEGVTITFFYNRNPPDRGRR